MNRELANLVSLYATKGHTEISTELQSMSKDNIIAALTDLLTIYFNDKNSSALREYILVIHSGFEPNKEKLGYNGFRQTATMGQPESCEAKPKNINTNDDIPKKLDGSGNFTDYTFGRLARDIDSNPLMVLGGFINGRLIYVCQFPFNSESFTGRLNDELLKEFPGGEDIVGKYRRSAGFRLRDYKDIDDIKVEVMVSRDYLASYKSFITKQLYSFLVYHL